MADQDLSRAQARSALAHIPRGSADGGQLRVHEVRQGAILQVAAWPETLEAVRRKLGDIVGLKAPRVGHAATGLEGTILSLGAGRYLVTSRSPQIRDRFQAAIGAAEGAVTDLGHGRTTLALDGEQAAAVLAKGLAIDLHALVFPPGRVAQSVIHHIDVTVHRVEVNLFELTVLRGFAEDFVHWLMDAGLEFGIVFAGPTA